MNGRNWLRALCWANLFAYSWMLTFSSIDFSRLAATIFWLIFLAIAVHESIMSVR